MRLLAIVLWCACTCRVTARYVKLPPCQFTGINYDNTCEICRNVIKSETCDHGYTCTKVEDPNFDCYYTRYKGWKEYADHLQIEEFKPANNGPLPIVSAISLYQRNFTSTIDGEVYGSPALNVTVNIPYLLYGTDKVEVSPKSLRMRFSSISDLEVRDTYYYNNPITRLYRFDDYMPTSYDIIHPKKVVFQCLNGLDICGAVRVFTIQLTAFAFSHKAQLFIQQNFTATAFIKAADWMPIIATAVLPNRSVYVVFGPEDSRHLSYEIYLEDGNGHLVTRVHSVTMGPNQNYSCVFHDILPGTYKVKLLARNFLAEEVHPYESYNFVVLGTRKEAEPDEVLIVWPLVILVIAISIVIAAGLLTLLYTQRQNTSIFLGPWCNQHRQPVKEVSKKKIFLLYSKEDQKNQQLVSCFENFLKGKLASVEVKCGTDGGRDGRIDQIQEEIRQCSHMLILWSPAMKTLLRSMDTATTSIEVRPHSAHQEFIKSAINVAKEQFEQANLKIIILYIPGYADENSIAGNFGTCKRYDLTSEAKRLCKDLTEGDSAFNTIPENALYELIENILNLSENTEVSEEAKLIPYDEVENHVARSPNEDASPVQNLPEEVPVLYRNEEATICEEMALNTITSYVKNYGESWPEELPVSPSNGPPCPVHYPAIIRSCPLHSTGPNRKPYQHDPGVFELPSQSAAVSIPSNHFHGNEHFHEIQDTNIDNSFLRFNFPPHPESEPGHIEPCQGFGHHRNEDTGYHSRDNEPSAEMARRMLELNGDD